MAGVHLRPVTLGSYKECLALQVDAAQEGLVASNAQSLLTRNIRTRVCTSLGRTWPTRPLNKGVQ